MSAALLTEDEAPHLVAQSLDLFWIGGRSKALRQGEKCFLFFLLGFETLLDELDEHAIVAEPLLSGNALNLLGQSRWQGYTPSNLFACGHGTIIHQCGAM